MDKEDIAAAMLKEAIGENSAAKICMISDGKTIRGEVEGNGKEVLNLFAHIVSSLSENFPASLLIAAVMAGLDHKETKSNA